MSRERRFFVADLDAAQVTLTGDEAHHLVHVLRLSEGTEVVLFDGKGRAVSARIARVAEDTVNLEVGAPLPSRESPLELTVAVAPPKGDKMSLIVQKLTELGVTTIQPLLSEHGESGERPERWKRVALEAAKQCGRSRLPSIEPPRTFDEMARPGALLLSPGAPPLESTEKRIVLVGPEGGWSDAELELARDRSLEMFGLGPRTLRTETAAIAAATLMQWIVGDFRTH